MTTLSISTRRIFLSTVFLCSITFVFCQPAADKVISIAISFMDDNVGNKKVYLDGQMIEQPVRKKIPNLTVTLIDPCGEIVIPPKEKLKVIKTDDGILVLALRTQDNPLPYRFGIKAEAKGYITVIQNFRIRESKPYYFLVNMVNLESSFSGQLNVAKKLKLKNGKTTDSTHIKYGENAMLEIPARATIFSGPNDTSNYANLRSSYSVPNPISTRTFPRWGTRFKNPSDDPFSDLRCLRERARFAPQKRPTLLIPYGWVTIDVAPENQPFDPLNYNRVGLVRPIKATFFINQNQQQKEVRLIKENDLIPIWSISDDGVWKKEGTTRVQKKQGKNDLYATFKINHLSTWALATEAEVCASPLQINYKTNGEQTLFSEIMLNSSSSLIELREGNNIITYANGTSSFNISNVPGHEPLRFVAYSDQTAQGMIKASMIIKTSSCSTMTSDVLDLSVGNIYQKKLRFVYDTGTSERFLCDTPIWYKYCNACGSGAAGLGDCASATGPFDFGGHLNTQGEATLTSIGFDMTGRCCLRLWYGTVVSGMTASQDWLTIMIDFSNTSTTYHSIQGKTKSGSFVNLECKYDNTVPGGAYVLKFTGSTPFATCN